MILTLLTLIIWTPSGLRPELNHWSSLTCREIQINAEDIVNREGGQYSLDCEEFNPIHEADINPYITDYSPQLPFTPQYHSSDD